MRRVHIVDGRLVDLLQKLRWYEAQVMKEYDSFVFKLDYSIRGHCPSLLQ